MKCHMLGKFHDWLRPYAHPGTIVVLLVLSVGLLAALSNRLRWMGVDAKSLEASPWYSPHEAREFFKALDEKECRRAYAISAWTLDLAFVIVAALLACLMLSLSSREWSWVLGLPLLAAFFDLSENGFIAYLACRYPGWGDSVAIAAATCTLLKQVFYGLTLFAVVVVCASWLWHWNRS